MKIFIQDANVIFDLFAGELLDAWFALGHETSTTSFILNEIEDPKQGRAIEQSGTFLPQEESTLRKKRWSR